MTTPDQDQSGEAELSAEAEPSAEAPSTEAEPSAGSEGESPEGESAAANPSPDSTPELASDADLERARAAARAHERRKSVRRWRRIGGAVSLTGPTLWMLYGEAFRRGPRILTFPYQYKLSYWGGIAQSLVFWGVILYAASRRRSFFGSVAAGLFFMLFVVIMGSESAFHAVWNIYLCIDAQIHSKNFIQALVGTLPLARPLVLFHFAAAFLVGAVFLVVSRKLVRPRKWRWYATLPLVPGVIYGATQIPTSYRGIQASPPDALYIHGLTALAKELLDITNDSPDLRVQRRKPEHVPPLSRHPARPRNVVLILQESQRGDVVCIEPDQHCDRSTPWSNAVVPKRMPLLELRSNASTTAISISNIWSGVRPTESRELLHSVPLLWDYADAAGYDTAYWTSQNLMFGNARQYVQDLPISHGCNATHLDSEADIDAGAYDNLLTDWVKKDWPEMKEPFFAVIHFSNVHYPYVFDDDLAPFRPALRDHSAENNTALFNYYKDVVQRSDLAVAELVRYIRSTDAGKHTVIVYTSDHGESFREHWQMGHTSSLYDEEVRVQGWIDAPEGTLSPEEEETIKRAKDEFVWHLDLAPTFLDLLGVWDDPKMAPFKARMMGHPITRRERTLSPLPMTNCTWVWECSFRNWGMMQGSLKAEAREWDGSFKCFDVKADPDEHVDLGERACAPLPDLAREIFHAMPDVTPPGRPVVKWK
ncbi:MAG: sulfatase-like hydrolase/transferase [Polyangiaceae bacterium]